MALDFDSIHKGEPSVGDVHVATALGNSNPGKKKKPRLTTVGETATLPGPKDVTDLAAVDFNHAHIGEDGQPNDEPVYIVRPRRRDPKANTVGKPVVEHGTLKRAPAFTVGDLITVESDTGTASNAPWTSEVIWTDGKTVKVKYDDGEAVYRFDLDNLTRLDRSRNKTGRPHHWFFSKHDLPGVKLVKVDGITVEVETPKGHRRIEASEKGIHHDVVFSQDYGRVPGTVGADGDQVDAYVGDALDSAKAWVINQVVAGTDLFDEVKLMLGFPDKKTAKAAYMESHFDGRGEERLAEMLRVDLPVIKAWLESGDTRAPFPGGELSDGWTPQKAAERVERAKLEKRGDPEPERKLVPFARGLVKNPFPTHRHAMSLLRPDQTPRFFEAFTHRKRLDKRKMRLGDLTAIQDRLDPQKVQAIRDGEHNSSKDPLIVRFAGRNYIIDGDHHLAADWLDGKNRVKVRFSDLTARTEAMKRAPAHKSTGSPEFKATFNVLKMQPEKRLIFGWFSVSTIDGELVVDKQGDIIFPEDLETAAYDFVLNAGTMGHMHDEIDVGRPVESCVFTAEKQALWGIDIGMEAWWGGFYVDSDKVWTAVKRGELPEFSIGGHAVPVEV